MKTPVIMFMVGIAGISCIPSYATVYDLDAAIDNVRNACMGIESKMDHLKLMAGINTGINAVGTVAGTGALAAGIVKAQKDKEVENILSQLETKFKNSRKPTSNEINDFYNDFIKLMGQNFESETDITLDESDKKLIEQKNKLEQESKTLGNVRTGLLAGNTATQVAGAVIASQNKASGSLKEQINNCITATDDLKDSMMQARLENKDTTQAKRIVDACSEYKYADLSKINNLATGATITSSIGAVAGGVGTITSAVANTDTTRNDNSSEGKTKEKNLNTASNVLSGVSTATSAVSTVLNGVQIATIKKVVSTANNCEKELR